MTDRSPARPTRRQVLAAGLGAGAALAAAGGPLSSWARASATSPVARDGSSTGVALAVDPGVVVGRLPARTMGLSFERATLATPLFSPDAAPLIALFGRLGPGVLRLGGNSVERTAWNPTGSGQTPGSVAPADVARLAGFAEAVDWPVLYGTPFIGGTADSVADEATAVAAALGSGLTALELCNEPDLYVLDATASAVAGTYPAFRARWETFAGAVASRAPTVALSGPATCLLQSAASWTEAFASDEGARLGLLTQHYYRDFGGPETIAELLGDDPLFDSTLPQVTAAAAGAGLGWRLAETNSFANGGSPGVSNTLASALWGVGLILRAAALGAEGVNVHTSGAGAGYPPFVQVNGVVTEIRPLFYGLLLVAAVGSGPLVEATLAGGPEGLAAWAVARADGSVAVVVVNTSDAAADLAIALPGTIQSAVASALTGPALDATTGVTFRGAPVDPDGTWDPDDPTSLAVTATGAQVQVGAGSALLVELTPTPAPSSTTSTTSTSSSSSSSTSASSPAVAGPAQPVAASPTFAG